MNFDHVIVAHEKDFDVLPSCVDGLKHIKNRTGKVYIISTTDPKIEGTTFVDESIFYDMFPKKDIFSRINQELHTDFFLTVKNYDGWLFQQFVKLFFWKKVETESDAYHVVDADTIFLRETDFGNAVFPYPSGDKYFKWTPIDSTLMLLTGMHFDRVFVYHNMVFNKKYIKEVENMVVEKHNCSFFDAVIKSLYHPNPHNFSEYSLYGNYILQRHPNLCEEIELSWEDISYIPDENQKKELSKEYNFVSAHTWKRERT